MSKKSTIIIVVIYICLGLIWLIGGNWVIDQYINHTSVGIQYLYAIKNVIFLFATLLAVILYLNTYYKTRLHKERLLNKQLRESRDSLNQLLDTHNLVTRATSDVAWDYDIVKDELKWLSGYGEVFGYAEDQDELVVKDAFWNMNRIHEDDRERLVSTFRKLLSEKQRKWIAEYRYQCKDGSFKYVQDRGYLILNGHNEPVRMLGAMQDIDLIKKYSLELELKNKKLGEIAWLNSHEIRRPLSNLLGLIPVVKAQVDDPEALLQLLDYVEQSAKELDETVHKINQGTSEK